MKKLALDVEELRVESFEADSAGLSERGTVQGNSFYEENKFSATCIQCTDSYPVWDCPATTNTITSQPSCFYTDCGCP